MQKQLQKSWCPGETLIPAEYLPEGFGKAMLLFAETDLPFIQAMDYLFLLAHIHTGVNVFETVVLFLCPILYLVAITKLWYFCHKQYDRKVLYLLLHSCSVSFCLLYILTGFVCELINIPQILSANWHCQILYVCDIIRVLHVL